MIKKQLESNWRMRTFGMEDWQEARVPGTVYTDLLRNGNMADPFWRDNEKEALALMEHDYEYRTDFYCDRELLQCREICLHFDGIDTIGEIWLNENFVGEVCNMHRTWEFLVKDLLTEGENRLRVILHSPLKYIREEFQKAPTRGSEDAMEGFVHIRKAHCMFGWDWGAHLPDAGIFRPVSLLGVEKDRITDFRIHQEHGKKEVRLQIEIKSEYTEQPLYQVSITDPEGKTTIYKNSPKEILIENPQLWWPNGLGQQPLYTVKAELIQEQSIIDTEVKRIGLRTMTIQRKKDNWGESFAHEVNGKTVFAMGADYIPEDHLLGRTTAERTRQLLMDCKEANFNTIRVWGGGYYPEDWFYDICDELGLMVWQDFMFACGVYDLTPEFEENITQEFIDNIRRIRHHASLALWCGNNEMEMFVDSRNWVTKPSEVRDYLLMYERIIPGVLKKYDGDTFYWPASPSSGGSFDEPNSPDRGDVHYWDVWHGNKPFTEYRKFFFRYVSEFGFQSFPCLSTVKTFTDREEDWNIFSYIMEKHQRNGSANGKIMNYMQQTYKYPSSFEAVLYASQMLQADAIRYGVEHFRRNRGRCMGAVYWQLNDCWPVASWSSIDYTGRWKALHYFAKRFFAPILISCEEEGWINQEKNMNEQHFQIHPSIHLNVENETLEDEKLCVFWAVRNSRGEILREEETELEVPAMTAVWLPKEELPELDIWSEYVSYGVRRGEDVLSEGTVIFSLPKYFRYEEPQLTYKIQGDEILVSSRVYARGVEVQNEAEDLILSDNYFDMNAGEKRIKILRGNAEKLRLRSVYDIR